MPSVYLSPSTQEYNPAYGGGTEEYYMNLIADAIEPYLTASGITFSRNTPDMTASQSASQSNQGNYNLHFAIHSNASPVNLAGRQRGADFYFYTTSARGKQAADIMVANYKKIYPNPDRVKALGNTTFAELRRTRAPAVLAELVYHDNAADMDWLRNNIPAIGRNLAQSIAQFLGVQFVDPNATASTNCKTNTCSNMGTVSTQGGRLNIRNAPSLEGEVLGQIPNGSSVMINGRDGNWFRVSYNGINGYIFSEFIVLN